MPLTTNNWFQINEFVKGEFSRAGELSSADIEKMLEVIGTAKLDEPREGNPFLGDDSDFNIILSGYNDPSVLRVLDLGVGDIDDAKMVFRHCILQQLFEKIDALPSSCAQKVRLLTLVEEKKALLKEQNIALISPPNIWDATKVYHTNTAVTLTVAAVTVLSAVALSFSPPDVRKALAQKLSSALGGIRLNRDAGWLVGLIGCVSVAAIYHTVRWCRARPELPVSATVAGVLNSGRGSDAASTAPRLQQD